MDCKCKKIVLATVALALFGSLSAAGDQGRFGNIRPVPAKNLLERMRSGADVIGIETSGVEPLNIWGKSEVTYAEQNSAGLAE